MADDIYICAFCRDELYCHDMANDIWRCLRCESEYQILAYSTPSIPNKVLMLKTPGPSIVQHKRKQGEVVPVPDRKQWWQKFSTHADEQFNAVLRNNEKLAKIDVSRETKEWIDKQAAFRNKVDEFVRDLSVPRETNSHNPEYVLYRQTDRWLQQVFHPGRLESTRDCLEQAVDLLQRWHKLSQEKQDLSQK